MKKLTSLILLLNSIVIISSVANAQAPQSIPYQAVARDSIGNPIANQNISLRFSVHDATANGTVVYRETHNATTNPLGLFTVNIGNGTIISGTFTTIDWGGGSKFMQVEMDATGGTSYVDMGAQQMLSVPYALNAANGNWTKSGNDIYKSNSGNVGIGTSTPNANLHVVGNIKMNDGNEGIGKILKSDSNGLASWGMLSGADILTTQPNALSLSCPVVAGSVGTGSGPNALVVSGNYLYIACSGDDKMQVIDITNPVSPILVGSENTDIFPQALAISGNNIFVANPLNNTIQVIDITNANAPNTIGYVGTGDVPYAIAISGTYAFVVNAGDNTMQVINISDPSSPFVASTLTTDIGPQAITISGNYAYILNSGSNSIQIINITNPLASFVAGAILTGVNPVALAVVGSNAFVACANSNSLQVINIANPSSPVIVGSVATDMYPSSIVISGSYAFVANSVSNLIQVINISNPSSPFIASSVSTSQYPQSLAISGNYLFVGNAFSSNVQSIYLVCTNYALTLNPTTGQTTAVPYTWNIDGNNINNANGGNVGIGISSPKQRLQVNGNIAFTRRGQKLIFGSDLSLPGDESSCYITRRVGTDELFFKAADIIIRSEVTPIQLQTINTVNLMDLVGNTKMIFNTQNGRMGIGTLLPSASLHIVGNVKIADGTQGLNKILSSDSNGLASWVSPSSIITSGSFVDLATNQTAAGNKTWTGNAAFNNDIDIHGISAGTGSGGGDITNTGFGSNVLTAFAGYNSAFGYQALIASAGSYNTATGANALSLNSIGYFNSAFGFSSLSSNTDGEGNTAIGRSSLEANSIGNGNTGIGSDALARNTDGSSNTALGAGADVFTGSLTNATAIGANAIVKSSNALVLGNNVNVGIGNSSPSAKLHVSGSVKIVDGTQGLNKVLTSDSSGLASWTSLSGSGSVTNITAGNGLSGGIITNSGTISLTIPVEVNNGGTGTTTTFTNGSVIFAGTGGIYNQNNAKFFWDNTNFRLGLGTTVPYSTIHSRGGVFIDNSGFSHGNIGNPALTVDGAPSQDILRLRDSGANVRLIFNSSGNLGIGTSIPNARLHVAGQIRIVDGTQGEGKILRSNASGLASWDSIRSTDFPSLSSLYVDLTNSQTVVGNKTWLGDAAFNSNVGIGIATPFQRLQVNGNISFTAPGQKLYFASDPNDTSIYISRPVGTDGILLTANDIYIQSLLTPIQLVNASTVNVMNLAGTTKMIFNPQTGNSGFGTSNATATLTVNGSFSLVQRTISASTGLTDTDAIVYVTNGGNNISVTFPTPVGVEGKIITVARSIGSTGTITIDPGAGTIESLGGTLDASTSLSALGTFGAKVQFQSDGSNWLRLGNQ